MIVDVHTRIWESSDALGRAAESLRRRRVEPWQRPEISMEAHDEAMAPVQAAFIHGLESRHLGASIPIERVAEYVQTRPDKYVGFAGIDPADARPVKKLETALSLGLAGVTVSPMTQAFHPSASAAMSLYEACESNGVPVYFDNSHMLARDAKLEFGQPHLIDEVARSFPRLKIVIAGLGFPWMDQALTVLAKHPTVYADLSNIVPHPWRVYNALLAAFQHGVMDQVLFSSNFPFCTPERAIVTTYSINTFPQGTHLPSVPREQLRSVVERDVFACLGLKNPLNTPDPATKAPPAEPAMAEERAG